METGWFVVSRPSRRCCVMGRLLASALRLLCSRRSLKWHAAVFLFIKDRRRWKKTVALLQVEKKTYWKRRGEPAKVVTFSHDVTLKRFSHKPFSAFSIQQK